MPANYASNAPGGFRLKSAPHRSILVVICGWRGHTPVKVVFSLRLRAEVRDLYSGNRTTIQMSVKELCQE